MSLEDIMLNDISQIEKGRVFCDSTYHEVPPIGKLIETESRLKVTGV